MVALFVGGLSGCAVVSGLGSLDVVGGCDGGACDGGSKTDAGDGSQPPPGDSGVSDAAKPEAAPPGIACGTETCTGSAVCCADDAGAACATTSCAPGTKTIACDDQTDCPGGQICCYSTGHAQCASTCAGGDILCDPNAVTPQCTLPKTCTETSSIQGVIVHNCN